MSENRPGQQSAPVADPKAIQARLKLYRLDRFVKTLPIMEHSHADLHFDPGRKDVKQFYIHVPIESLADLKLWMGIPNDHIDHRKYRNHLKTVKVPTLTSPVEAEVLRVVDEQTVRNAQFNLLFGYVDEDLLREAFWKAAANDLLATYAVIPILLLQDLVLDDGQTVTISNTPTAFINTLTIFGSAQIKLHSGCKVIANTIKSLPLKEGPGIINVGQ